jgi:hypothetical protein
VWWLSQLSSLGRDSSVDEKRNPFDKLYSNTALLHIAFVSQGHQDDAKPRQTLKPRY